MGIVLVNTLLICVIIKNKFMMVFLKSVNNTATKQMECL